MNSSGIGRSLVPCELLRQAYHLWREQPGHQCPSIKPLASLAGLPMNTQQLNSSENQKWAIYFFFFTKCVAQLPLGHEYVIFYCYTFLYTTFFVHEERNSSEHAAADGTFVKNYILLLLLALNFSDLQPAFIIWIQANVQMHRAYSCYNLVTLERNLCENKKKFRIKLSLGVL